MVLIEAKEEDLTGDSEILEEDMETEKEAVGRLHGIPVQWGRRFQMKEWVEDGEEEWVATWEEWEMEWAEE